MTSAKAITIAPISARDAAELVRRYHYSGTVVRNSCLHLGAFVNGECHGVMTFGPPMDKSKVLHLVRDTAWYNMLELNRMAFSDHLPRNSESRCLAIARKLIARHYPNIEWILTFADGTRCGDGTIYRASGADLIGIRPNSTLWKMPGGQIMAGMSIEAHWSSPKMQALCEAIDVPHVYRTRREWRALGAEPLPGFQLRYIWPKDDDVRARLTVPILSNSAIGEAGAAMYKGSPRNKQFGC